MSVLYVEWTPETYLNAHNLGRPVVNLQQESERFKLVFERHARRSRPGLLVSWARTPDGANDGLRAYPNLDDSPERMESEIFALRRLGCESFAHALTEMRDKSNAAWYAMHI